MLWDLLVVLGTFLMVIGAFLVAMAVLLCICALIAKMEFVLVFIEDYFHGKKSSIQDHSTTCSWGRVSNARWF